MFFFYLTLLRKMARIVIAIHFGLLFQDKKAYNIKDVVVIYLFCNTMGENYININKKYEIDKQSPIDEVTKRVTNCVLASIGVGSIHSENIFLNVEFTAFGTEITVPIYYVCVGE